VEQVVQVLNTNSGNAARVIRQAVAMMAKNRQCKCGSALENAIMTDPAKIPPATRQKLGLLVDKYLNKGQEAKA